jgi:hypothetical protein
MSEPCMSRWCFPWWACLSDLTLTALLMILSWFQIADALLLTYCISPFIASLNADEKILQKSDWNFRPGYVEHWHLTILWLKCTFFTSFWLNNYGHAIQSKYFFWNDVSLAFRGNNIVSFSLLTNYIHHVYLITKYFSLSAQNII